MKKFPNNYKKTPFLVSVIEKMPEDFAIKGIYIVKYIFHFSSLISDIKNGVFRYLQFWSIFFFLKNKPNM